jgi:hypothetical protein
MESLAEAFDEGIKECFKVLAEDLLKEHVSALIKGLAAEVVGASFGSVAKFVFKFILHAQDRVLVGLEMMIREPLMTGVRVAEESFDLPHNKFRRDQLMSALHNLERAETYSLKQKNPEQTATIRIFQMLCLAEIVGGSALARKKFRDVEPVLQFRFRAPTEESQLLAERSEQECARAEEYRRWANEVRQQERSYPSYLMSEFRARTLSRPVDIEFLARVRAEESAAYRQRANRLRRQAQKVNLMLGMLAEMVKAAEERDASNLETS